MNRNTALIWGAIAVLIIILGFWWWNSAYNNPTLGAAEYGTPAASSTGALAGPSATVVAENRSSSAVAGIIAELSNSSRFAGLLSQTGVSAQVTGKGPYTVFVPTDGSFGRLPTGTINNLSAAQLKRLVQYHVISGKMIDVNAQVAGNVTALSKDPLNFSKEVDDVSARVNSSKIVRAYKASNGMVYVIDTVLLPPLPPQN